MGIESRQMSRRTFLRGVTKGVGAVAAASALDTAIPGGIMGGSDAAASGEVTTSQPTGSESASAEQVTYTESELTAYNQQLRIALTAKIEAAKNDQSTLTPSSELTYQELLAPITHWNEVTSIVMYYVDTYMLQRTTTGPLPTQEKIHDATDLLNSGYILNFAVIVDRVLTKWMHQLGQSINPENGYSGRDWDRNISPLRRMILCLLDIQNGITPRMDTDKIYKITRNENGLITSSEDVEKTFKEELFRVFQYVLIDLNTEFVANYHRDLDTGKPDDTTSLPRMAISGTHSFDTDGLIGFINQQVFDQTALKRYTQATSEHISMTPNRAAELGIPFKTRVLSFFLGRPWLEKQLASEKRLLIAERVKEDLGNLVLPVRQ